MAQKIKLKHTHNGYRVRSLSLWDRFDVDFTGIETPAEHVFGGVFMLYTSCRYVIQPISYLASLMRKRADRGQRGFNLAVGRAGKHLRGDRPVLYYLLYNEKRE